MARRWAVTNCGHAWPSTMSEEHRAAFLAKYGGMGALICKVCDSPCTEVRTIWVEGREDDLALPWGSARPRDKEKLAEVSDEVLKEHG